MGLKAGFKRTEVGTIPSDWSLVRLSDLVDENRTIRYGIVQPGRFAPQGRLMVRGQDYSTGWVLPDEMFRVAPSVEEPFARARIQRGDILVTIVGASTGRIAVVPDWLDGANLTQTTARIAISATAADALYCAQVLASWYGEQQVRSYIKGGAQPGLNCGDLDKFVVPLPPTVREQQAIAAVLQDADDLILELSRLLAKKRQIKQGVMQELLTGKRRLPGFTEEWTSLKLANLISGLDAGVSVNSDEAASGSTSEKRILKTSCVSGGRFIPGESKAIAGEEIGRARVNPRRNSLIISRMNTPALVGECGFVDRDWPSLYLPDRLWQTRHNGEAHSVRWLGYLLGSPQFSPTVKETATGTSGSMKNISKAAFLSLDVPFPALQEQIAIAEVLAVLDQELDGQEAQLAKARQLKQAMMQELLAGRIRVVCQNEKEFAPLAVTAV